MKKMYTPLQIAGMEIKNRTFMAPMSLGYESQDGTVNEKMAGYWLRRAKGGVAVSLWMPPVWIPMCRILEIHFVSGMKRASKSIKVLQIRSMRMGVRSFRRSHIRVRRVSAPFMESRQCQQCISKRNGADDKRAGKRGTAGIVALYAKAGKAAKDAGFDGIELHCAHAYMLLGSFLSPLRNKRMDEYGGSLLNRARLLFEVLDAIKETCGREFPIILRMSGSERDPQGNTVEDMKRLIPYLEQHGVDCFEISGGTQYERCNKIIPCHGEEEFTNLKEAREIKAVATKPVITVGKILDAKLAEDVLEAEEVDGVVIGRALLADPDFVEKAKEGRYEEIAPCAACGVGCVGEQTKRRPASCVINPLAGRELEFEEQPAKEAKKILVVGAGIAGLAAARILAKRGYHVLVAEKEQKAGGS